ncbi:lipase member H isoform X3 [Sinocyclocheilus rhinocerous]|uniref:lipase member H isoform X3 n=1 Tax=Sinocyclocheilus rhinocerous TaxID=307959 RepID=UPI0007B97D0B|nr:PREDICTED: lipase member H-like isoform X3 [Sinocyclocheilus rhinocerous]
MSLLWGPICTCACCCTPVQISSVVRSSHTTTSLKNPCLITEGHEHPGSGLEQRGGQSQLLHGCGQHTGYGCEHHRLHREYGGRKEGASLDSIHLIGVSLGAHVAGFIGAMLGGRVGRITGLDPAGPMFASAPPEERLDPTDAQFVDVLHTDMNSFGLRGTHGHIDFYANGGLDQPGCPKTIFSGKSYFVCDHQRSVFLYLCALNHTCKLMAYPCSSYSDFLSGQCLQCETFKPASCPVLGYDMSQWRDTLLRLGQTRAYFSTTAELPYSKTSYRVDLVTWNQFLRWGVVILRLYNGKNVIESQIDTKQLRFEQYTSTRLLAQFDEDLYPIQKISLRIVTGNMIGPRYKIRLLRIRITPLENPNRPLMCRYDIILEENAEVSFKPLPCD